MRYLVWLFLKDESLFVYAVICNSMTSGCLKEFYKLYEWGLTVRNLVCGHY